MPRADAARTFEQRLLRALPELSSPEGRPRILVAASGGADSTALLVALHALVADGRVAGELIACHIDHGLRPEAARWAEQELLVANCRALDLPLVVRAVQVEARPRAVRGSLEAAARAARYAALGAVAAAAGASAVLTAHTAGDQAETVLLRLLRGTGVGGLAAIPPASRPWDAAGPLLVRPLLGVWPEETRRYCRARGVAWSEDETNASARFVRNRVRHELLPLLRSLDPGADRSLVRLAGQARELRAWLDGEVGRVFTGLWRRDADGYVLQAAPAAMAPFLGKQVVVRVLTELLGGPGAPGERQVEALFACWQGPLGRRCDMGRGWHAESTRDGLRLRQHASASAASPAAAVHCWPLQFGTAELAGWRVTVSAFNRGDSAPAADPLAAYLALPDPARLAVRFWRPGDRMRPAGLAGSKKLQDIFVDEKIERSRRAGIPLVVLDGECVWTVGVKRSRLAAAAPGDVAAVCVCFAALSSEEQSGGAGERHRIRSEFFGGGLGNKGRR